MTRRLRDRRAAKLALVYVEAEAVKASNKVLSFFKAAGDFEAMAGLSRP
jgi:hypothetical protein